MEQQIVTLAMSISLIYFIEGMGEVICKKKDAGYIFCWVICPLYVALVLAYLTVRYL